MSLVDNSAVVVMKRASLEDTAKANSVNPGTRYFRGTRLGE